MKKDIMHPEIYTGQTYLVDGEEYEITDIRVTNVISKEVFTTSAFFRSKEKESKNPTFEESIKKIVGNPIYKALN